MQGAEHEGRKGGDFPERRLQADDHSSTCWIALTPVDLSWGISWDSVLWLPFFFFF